MQLTQFTDYSLRTLIYLADRPGVLCTIGEISEWHAISKAHLVKVVHNLTKLGYVKSTRGKGGGIELNMGVDAINVGKLVREIEPHFEIVECFNSETNTCRLAENCKLKFLLSDANKAFLAVLDAKTLGDL